MGYLKKLLLGIALITHAAAYGAGQPSPLPSPIIISQGLWGTPYATYCGFRIWVNEASRKLQMVFVSNPAFTHHHCTASGQFREYDCLDDGTTCNWSTNVEGCQIRALDSHSLVQNCWVTSGNETGNFVYYRY